MESSSQPLFIMDVAMGGRHQSHPALHRQLNAAMLPDEFPPVTRKWTMSGPSRTTSSKD